MRLFKGFIPVILVLLLLLPVSAPQAATQELIQNGSFENALANWTTVTFGTAIWETRTGGQAGTHSGNAENPLAGGGANVAYGNTGAAGRAALYQDVTIPATATNAFFSADIGYQPPAGGVTEFFVADIIDTLGLPNDFNYAGGTIYTQYYFRTNAAGADPMAARAPLDLLGVAGITPGATIRIRFYVQQGDFNARATVDRVSLVIYTDDTQGTDPDTGPPKGGADDLFGACGGADDWMPLGLSGHTTQVLPNGADLSLNRLLPIPSVATNGEANSGAVEHADEVPGMIIRLTSPSGQETEFFIGLGESGTLANGVGYTSEVINCVDVRAARLGLTWPASVLSGLEPGLWTISYISLDSDGLASNTRWEHLDVGQAAAESAIQPRAGQELNFALGVYQFSEEDLELHPVSGGTCEVRQNGVLSDTFRIENGRLNAAVPFGTTSRMRLNWPGTNEVVQLRMEFADGFLKVYDENRGDKEVEVFQVLGTDTYALEFYRNKIYISGQGDENGPVLGRLYGPWPK